MIPGKYHPELLVQERVTIDLESLPPAIAQLQALGDIGEHPRFARLGRRLAEGFSADAKVDLSGLADTKSPFALTLNEHGISFVNETIREAGLPAITQNPEAILRELDLHRLRIAIFVDKETDRWKALNLQCSELEAFLKALLSYTQLDRQLEPLPADAGRAALANDPEEELRTFKGAVWQPEIRDISRVDEFLKVLIPLAWQLRLDVYDVAKGVYLPVFHTPVPQEAGSRYLLTYYPKVATRDIMLDGNAAWGIVNILGDENAVPKPDRKSKLFAPMPLPFISHLSRKDDLLLADSEERCFWHKEWVRDRFIWRLQGPLEEQGFVLKRRNLGCFDFKRSKGKQSISTAAGGYPSIFLYSHSKRLADIFIQHMGEKHCKKVCVLSEDCRRGVYRTTEGFTTYSLNLGVVRRLCVPSWVAVAESSAHDQRDVYVNHEINMSVTSYEEIDWLAEDLLHYALPIMNEALTVRGMDNLYNKKFCVSNFLRVASYLLEPVSSSLIYARLAGNPEFDRIADEIRQALMKEEKEYYTYFPQLNSGNQAQTKQYRGLQRINEAHPMGEK